MTGITVKGAKSGKARFFIFKNIINKNIFPKLRKNFRQILNDFEIGYASSSRSSCRYGDCKINDCKIEKGEIRVSVKMVDEEKLGLVNHI